MMHMHGGQMEGELAAQVGEQGQEDRRVHPARIAHTQARTGRMLPQEVGDRIPQRPAPDGMGNAGAAVQVRVSLNLPYPMRRA